MPDSSCNFNRAVRLVAIFTTLPLSTLAQMTTAFSNSSSLRIPRASVTITAQILSAEGYVGLVHPTQVLASHAPWTTRGECEYGYRLLCTNSKYCDVGNYKTAWQGPTRYEGLGSSSGATYTEYCELHDMTSADCVRVTTPVYSYSRSSSKPYLASTTTFTLSDSLGIDFAQVPITGVGYGNGEHLNGHEYFLEHYKSCLGTYIQPTAVPVTPTTTSATHTTISAVRATTSAAPPKSGGLSHGAKLGLGLGLGLGGGIVLIIVLVFCCFGRRSRAADGTQKRDGGTTRTSWF